MFRVEPLSDEQVARLAGAVREFCEGPMPAPVFLRPGLVWSTEGGPEQAHALARLADDGCPNHGEACHD